MYTHEYFMSVFADNMINISVYSKKKRIDFCDMIFNDDRNYFSYIILHNL